MNVKKHMIANKFATIWMGNIVALADVGTILTTVILEVVLLKDPSPK